MTETGSQALRARVVASALAARRAAPAGNNLPGSLLPWLLAVVATTAPMWCPAPAAGGEQLDRDLALGSAELLSRAAHNLLP